MKIRHSSHLRAAAAHRGEVVFGCGFDQPISTKTSRHYVYGTMDISMANAAFAFMCALRHQSPEEAFRSITWPAKKLDEVGTTEPEPT